MKNAIPLLFAASLVAACSHQPYLDPAERVATAQPSPAPRPVEARAGAATGRAREYDQAFGTTAMVCTKSPCRIEVVANEGGCKVAPEIVFVKRGGPGVRVEWHVARDSKARFAARPFQWTPASREDAAGQFDEDQGLAADGSYGIVVRNTKRGALRYQLTILRDGWSCAIDAPLISDD